MENVNQSLFFLRHGKLLLPYENHSEMPFMVISDLASGKMNPSLDADFARNILMPGILDFVPFDKIDEIYTSPSRRSMETAELIKEYILKKFDRKIAINVAEGVREIEFDLDGIYRGIKFDYNSLNEKVFMAMSTGNNSESAEIAQKRIGEFLKKINSEQGKKILVITHDFIMRIIENCIKGNDVITYTELVNTHRNNYLKGFCTNHEFSNIFYTK